MRAVIMAAGDGHRWKNYLGVPKQLVPVDGEAILHRTVRILLSIGITDVYVTVRQNGIFGDLKGAREYLPTDSEFEIDRIWGARKLVDRSTVFVYGDAYYTESSLATITSCKDSRHFFGRPFPSPCKPFGKLFGVLVDDFVLSKAEVARDLYRSRKLCRCVGWELYGLCTGTPRLGEGKRFFFPEADYVADDFTIINDQTEDFNEPFEFERWRECYRKQ